MRIIGRHHQLSDVGVVVVGEWGDGGGGAHFHGLPFCAQTTTMYSIGYIIGEKNGNGFRLLWALIGYLAEWRIEIIPRFVRIGRNIPCDRLSGTDGQGVADWARIMGAKPVNFPDAWLLLADSRNREVEF